jgi:hypothetical protein
MDNKRVSIPVELLNRWRHRVARCDEGGFPTNVRLEMDLILEQAKTQPTLLTTVTDKPVPMGPCICNRFDVPGLYPNCPTHGINGKNEPYPPAWTTLPTPPKFNIEEIKQVMAEMREEPDNGPPGGVSADDVTRWVIQLEKALGYYQGPTETTI